MFILRILLLIVTESICTAGVYTQALHEEANHGFKHLMCHLKHHATVQSDISSKTEKTVGEIGEKHALLGQFTVYGEKEEDSSAPSSKLREAYKQCEICKSVETWTQRLSPVPSVDLSKGQGDSKNPKFPWFGCPCRQWGSEEHKKNDFPEYAKASLYTVFRITKSLTEFNNEAWKLQTWATLWEVLWETATALDTLKETLKRDLEEDDLKTLIVKRKPKESDCPCSVQ